MRSSSLLCRLILPCALFAVALAPSALFADADPLPAERTRSGTKFLSAFAPVVKPAHDSVVILELGERRAALGTVIDSRGLILTKASEVTGGELNCKLPNSKRVPAQVLASDDESDLALVKVETTGLKAVRWAHDETVVGQWAITPGIEFAPEAVGIVSVPARRILHKRAYIGVQLDFQADNACIAEVMPGMSAEKAGLKPGDVILGLNDTVISSSEALVNSLKQFREGQSVKLRVRRDNADPFEITLTMTLPRPERGRRGFDRAERMNRLGGEVSRRAEGFEIAFQHDSVLQPWQCGGPLLNLEGYAIGLNIARAGRIASYALPSDTVTEIADRLKRESQTLVRDKPSS